MSIPFYSGVVKSLGSRLVTYFWLSDLFLSVLSEQQSKCILQTILLSVALMMTLCIEIHVDEFSTCNYPLVLVTIYARISIEAKFECLLCLKVLVYSNRLLILIFARWLADSGLKITTIILWIFHMKTCLLVSWTCSLFNQIILCPWTSPKFYGIR